MMEESSPPRKLGDLSPFLILETIRHLGMSDFMNFLATCRSLYELLILELHKRDRDACMSIAWGAFYGLIPTLERSRQVCGLRNMALTEQHIEGIFGQSRWRSFAPEYPCMAHKPNCAFDLAVGGLQIEAAEWLLREGGWELVNPSKAVLSILIHMIPRTKLVRTHWSACALPADAQPRTTVIRQLMPLLKTVMQRAGDPNLILTCLAGSATFPYTHERTRVGWHAGWEYVPRPRLYLASIMLRDMPDCVFDLWLELGGDIKHLCGHTRGAIPLVQLLKVFFHSTPYLSSPVIATRDRRWKIYTGFEVPRFALTGEVLREELPRRLQLCIKSLFKSDKRGCMWKHAPELSLGVFFLMTPDLELTRSIVENRRYRACEAKCKGRDTFVPLAVKAVLLSPSWLTLEHLRNLRRAGVDLDEPSGQHAELFLQGFSCLIVPCHGLNALQVATTARKGESEALRNVEALLETGANPHIRNPNGATVLHVAVRQGHAQLVQKYLDVGVDPFAKDHRGFTAVEVGLTRGEKLRHLPAYCAIRTMLEKAMGKGSPEPLSR